MSDIHHQLMAAADPSTGGLLIGCKGQTKGTQPLASVKDQQSTSITSRPLSAAQAARQHVGTRFTQPTSKQRRPATAAVHGRLHHACTPEPDVTGGAACGTTGSRCSSARANMGSVNHTAMARLRAELAGLASIGNVQLQSLKPRAPSDTRLHTVDACAELEARVGHGACQLCVSSSKQWRKSCGTATSL